MIANGLQLYFSAPNLSGLSLALRRCGSSSLRLVPRALPVSRKAVVVASAKKFRGRRPPRPRFVRSTWDLDDDSEPLRDPWHPESKSPTDDRDNSSRTSNLGSPTSEPTPKEQSLLAEEEKEEPVRKAPLSGADVLLVLQHVAAQKRRPRRKSRQAGVKSGGGPEQGGDDEGVDARPLEIKEDWGPRLEELEKAVEEAQQQQLGDSA